MSELSRRKFCITAAATGATLLRPASSLLAQPAMAPHVLRVDESIVSAVVPEDFIGLSYESSQLSHPAFFSAENTALIRLFKTLSPRGVLRIGGNLSEFTVWSPEEVEDPNPDGTVSPDPGKGSAQTYTISPKSIRNLAAFLEATGWKLIYGLNLVNGTAESAVAEASSVAKLCGPRLIEVQFGNEPDLFKHRDQADKKWTYDEFLAKWKIFRKAFQEQLPQIQVAGPDISNRKEWVSRFAEDTKGEIREFTSHYYAEGPPTDPRMTIDYLLHPGTRFENQLRSPADVAKAAGLPYRMSEGNSCYGGGKAGVSDTFASALWAGDFLLRLANLGCAGANLHGGGNGFYTPIAGDKATGYTARPEYYGMILARHFSGSRMVPVTIPATATDLTAYAALNQGKRLMAVFNTSPDAAVVATDWQGASSKVHVAYLTAPSLESKTGVTFGSAQVAPDGSFSGPKPVKANTRGISIPAHTAALLLWD